MSFRQYRLTFALAAIAGVTAALLPVPSIAAIAPRDGIASLPSASVRESCPGVDASLQDALSPTWTVLQRPEHTYVQMVVHGRRIERIDVSEGTPDFRRMVRKAVRGLECNTDGRKQIDFMVNLNEPPAERARAR